MVGNSCTGRRRLEVAFRKGQLRKPEEKSAESLSALMKNLKLELAAAKAAQWDPKKLGGVCG
jgi:hypothetical protein